MRQWCDALPLAVAHGRARMCYIAYMNIFAFALLLLRQHGRNQ